MGPQGGEGVGEGLSVGVVEVHRETLRPQAGGGESIQQPVNMTGGGHPDGVAEAELPAPQVQQPAAHGDDLLDRHLALPRVAEGHGQVAADPDTRLACGSDDRAEHLDRFVQPAVEIPPGERPGGTA